MTCTCHIIPPEVLSRLAGDSALSDTDRAGLSQTAALDARQRKLRRVNTEISLAASKMQGVAGLMALTPQPDVDVYDCKTTLSLPGSYIADPAASADSTAVRAAAETEAVVRFYDQLFGRNSIDGLGMTLVSSIHYGVGYNNAFWNGAQMTYGDGNGALFLDFTLSTDVIAHELTHGVTQHSAGFLYTNEAGGLNESMSDAFGSMFRQWRKNQDVTQADWLIGAEILGASATARGFTCLRDMAKPDAKHCLSPQPSDYRKYIPGMDPHYSSGIPNHAFYVAATTFGGNSWAVIGKIWYDALTAYGRKPGTTFRAFADRTRASAAKLFSGQPAALSAVNKGWAAVGVP